MHAGAYKTFTRYRVRPRRRKWPVACLCDRLSRHVIGLERPVRCTREPFTSTVLVSRLTTRPPVWITDWA